MAVEYDNDANDDNYSNDTWTTLVQGPAMVSNVMMSNLSSNSIAIELRVYDDDSDADAAVWRSPPRTLDPDDIDTLDKGIALGASDQLQFRCDLPGMSIIASKVTET